MSWFDVLKNLQATYSENFYLLWGTIVGLIDLFLITIVLSNNIYKLKKTESELSRSREQFRSLVEDSPFGISLKNPDGKFEYINPKFTEIFGYTLEDIPDERAWFERLFGNNAVAMDDALRWTASFSEEGAPKESAPHEFTIRTDENREKTVLFRLVRMEDDSELITYEDVTEKKMLELKLLQSQKLESIGILASGIAHEINNPLSSIIGLADVALEEDDQEMVHELLGDILNYANRAANIVRDLSTYSRTAKSEDLSSMDLNKVIDESIKMVLHGTKYTDFEIVKKFQENQTINANKGELQQIFINLLTNALQAMEGKGTITISTEDMVVGGKPEDHMVKVRLADTGPGIPKKHLEMIYDPFFTTKPPGEGTGLGLNIVHRLVHKYGGTIEVESRENHGTAFTICLPKSEEEEGDEQGQ